MKKASDKVLENLVLKEKKSLFTNAVYTHSNNIGPWMLVQTVFCVVLSCIAVILSSEKPAAKL